MYNLIFQTQTAQNTQMLKISFNEIPTAFSFHILLHLYIIQQLKSWKVKLSANKEYTNNCPDLKRHIVTHTCQCFLPQLPARERCGYRFLLYQNICPECDFKNQQCCNVLKLAESDQARGRNYIKTMLVPLYTMPF